MATQTESPFPSLISSPTHIWTLHDVILDTPAWKANILHLEEQVDHFEKWVDGFTKALHQYMDVVTSNSWHIWVVAPHLTHTINRVQRTDRQFVQEDAAAKPRWILDW